MSPANAQSKCATHEEIYEGLQKNFGESLRHILFVDQQRIMAVFISKETGSWTILNVFANGRACVTNAGDESISFFPMLPPNL